MDHRQLVLAMDLLYKYPDRHDVGAYGHVVYYRSALHEASGNEDRLLGAHASCYRARLPSDGPRQRAAGELVRIKLYILAECHLSSCPFTVRYRGVFCRAPGC